MPKHPDQFRPADSRKKPGPKVFTGEQGARFERFWKTLMILTESDQPLSVKEINQRLGDSHLLADFVGNINTTRTDLKTMQRCGFPVVNVDANGNEIEVDHELSHQRGRYHNTLWKVKEGHEIGRFGNGIHKKPSKNELITLSLLRALLNDDVPNTYPLFRMLSKMAEALTNYYKGASTAGQPSEQLVTRFRVIAKEYIGPESDREILEKFHESSITGKTIRALYESSDGQRHHVELIPHYPYVASGKLYVLAIATAGGVKNYRLDRFSDVEVTDRLQSLTQEQLRELDWLVEGSFNGYVAEPKDVLIRIDKTIAYLFDQFKYHPSQRVTEKHPDGSIEVAYHCAVGFTLEEFILGLGEHVVVLEPAELCETIKKRLRGALSRYATD